MSEARIEILGRPSIRGDGTTEPVSLPGARAELVFAYLVVEHPRWVTRDELATVVWPEMLPDSWAAALRGVVTDVRRFLDAAGLPSSEVIVGARGGYQLRLPPDATVDLDAAREGVAEARRRLHDGDAAGAACAASRAAETTRLPFLPRHEGEWVDQVRKEVEELNAAALELCARGHAAAGDLHAARAAAERLVRIEPYREAAHQLAIEVLGGAGDRAGALRAYEQCRAVLRSELGLEPSAETDAVLQRALASPAHSSEQEHGALASYAVLVVEDHDFQRRTALALLRRLGVGTLLEAADGRAALELLAEVSPPDVIICDIDMPDTDGVEFIRRVAETGLASAVAIASGLDRAMLATVRAVAEGYGLQVLGAVEKPLTARVLTDLLAAYRPAAAPTERGETRRLDAAQISAGLSDRRIVAHLEPIADLATGRIVAAEIVPRWLDPATGTAEAVDFGAAFAAADTTERFSDRLVELGGQAAQELALDIAVRLPRARLADAALADRLVGLTPASRVVLTIEATALHGGAAVSLDVLARLRLKGFGLWLDDPGAATRLDNLPLTGVRIGAALPGATALHDAIDAARAHGLLTVGTRCASAAEFELLLEAGASHAQGAFVGDPVSAAELAELAPGWSPPVSDEGS